MMAQQAERCRRYNVLLLNTKQHTKEEGWFGISIDPVMIGALLNHGVKGLEFYLGIIQEQSDSAPEEDDIINGPGAMHHWMTTGIDLTMCCPCARKLFSSSPLCL